MANSLDNLPPMPGPASGNCQGRPSSCCAPRCRQPLDVSLSQMLFSFENGFPPKWVPPKWVPPKWVPSKRQKSAFHPEVHSSQNLVSVWFAVKANQGPNQTPILGVSNQGTRGPVSGWWDRKDTNQYLGCHILQTRNYMQVCVRFCVCASAHPQSLCFADFLELEEGKPSDIPIGVHELKSACRDAVPGCYCSPPDVPERSASTSDLHSVHLFSRRERATCFLGGSQPFPSPFGLLVFSVDVHLTH